VSELEVVRFARADQDAVRRLILDGLEEHWGALDPDLNPDLDDIAASYGAGAVLVARRVGGIVGAGAVVPTGLGEGEVKRLGVAREHRRSGVASALLREMVAIGIELGWRALVLETTATWSDAVGLYERFGFTLTHHVDGPFGRDAWFRLELPGGGGPEPG
jgi:ribosomal protein S18 acetylase RimI-like enzyme